ncbi:reverse transcriptase [Klebsormidium nitens]|uniref:Reverse transcriptase n=1 Tax=Klebsormidium nitens TaxID=105231 RepID=A0A1Y1I905_KLENI|nr:reverse transcriptase [Klebsormidium nitens]|eukprot:GAQ87420.1 reverse transcriptase [Klebsormidium nitens]
MLAKTIGERNVGEYLSGKRPHRVEFGNHRSFYTRWEFSEAEIRKNLKSGAVGIWPPDAEPPEVISPMGVVESAGKERLICNDRYVNAFLEQIPFEYEKLRDILAFTLRGFFMATADLRSGYFHVPIHPAYWKYFAFKVGKTVFFYKVLCFGFAQACYVFTKVMRGPILELRARGVPLSGYIDDSFTAAPTFGRALRQILFIVRLMGVALGAHFGLPKCQLEPVLLLKWLGFLVDSEQAEFRLGEGRMERLRSALAEMAESPTTSPRKLAKMAGLLASTAPAILPVALYSRSFYGALSGKETWDELFPTPAEVAETATFWLKNLERWNVRRWWPRPVAVSAHVDASEIRFGGWAELPDGRRLEIEGTFSEVQAGGSSTEREVIGYAAAIKVVTEKVPELITERAVMLTGDSQAGLAAIGKFRSSVPLIRSALKQVLELCAEFRCDLVTRWVPREDLAEADALSREPDASDWGVSASVFRKLTEHFGVNPSIDLFASATFHVAERFVAKYYTPGCTAVHAMALDWRELVQAGESAWIFSPVGLTTQVLERLSNFRVNALVCISAPKGSLAETQIRGFQGANALTRRAAARKNLDCTGISALGSSRTVLLQPARTN